MRWKCSVCNMIWEGDNPPDVCPKCGQPGEKYNKMSDEQVKTALRARKTNALHVELLSILPKLLDIAETGIGDNLDPRCLTIFERVKSEATFLTASIKAELEGHVGKGKWG